MFTTQLNVLVTIAGEPYTRTSKKPQSCVFKFLYVFGIQLHFSMT